MNIPIIQNFFIKKLISKNIPIVTPSSSNKISKIILLIDESHQDFKSNVLTKIKEFGFKEENISLLIYTSKLEKDKIYEFPTFSNESFSIFGKINSEILLSLMKNKFDLLINLYEFKNPILEYVSQKINSDFKVGLVNSLNPNNQLFIDCKLTEIKIYISETMKYLKILNKL